MLGSGSLTDFRIAFWVETLVYEVTGTDGVKAA